MLSRNVAIITGAAGGIGSAVARTFAARGAALCLAEDDDRSPPAIATAGFGYLRLRRSSYSTEDLHAWAERILSQPWGEAFVYFKHEDEALGPAFAMGLREVLAAAGPAHDPGPLVPSSGQW